MDIDLFSPFMASTRQMISQMSNIQVQLLENMDDGDSEIQSFGVTSIIAFTGKQKGRFLIDMDEKLALALASSIMGNNFNNIKENMALMAISEMNNIIAGDAITTINNQYSLSLRLAPPIVFAGRDVVVSIPKIHSKSAYGNTDKGQIKINIAWEGVK